jgi:DNA repair protein RecN (Recombination protein N)
MLRSLSIQNYALIDSLQIDFQTGFSTITGETGAGKSILLGALSLLVGQRADADILLDKTRKCIVESTFEVELYNLQSFFEQNEIDYNSHVIIRREILENGRSRAFINDSPVNLTILKELGDKLVDIHSQHQNSYLTDWAFQLKIIDITAKNSNLLNQYKEGFRKFNETKKLLAELTERSQKEQAELDYFQFQFNELEEAKLKPGEQQELEEELKVLSNAEEIKSHLETIIAILTSDSTGTIVQTKEALTHSQKLKNIFNKSELLAERLGSIYIEIKDIATETERLNDSIDLDPEKLEHVKSRIDLLYSLIQKHRIKDADELIELRDRLAERLKNIKSYSEQIDLLKKELDKETKALTTIALQLRKARKTIVPGFEEKVSAILRHLGIPNAIFTVNFEELTDFQSTGLDAVSYLFSANKQIPAQDIAKVASGGEISRVMLALKSVIASSLAMPAIIFDEIDTGVSGEIADKMGNIMKEMAGNMQVISITHLPQVAAKGKNQFLVYKVDGDKTTNSHIKHLSNEERVIEIAKMLSGKDVSEAAITNAKVLLQG